MDRKTEPPRGNRAFKESGGQAIHKSHPLIFLAQREENTSASITMLGGENGAEADGTREGVCVTQLSFFRLLVQWMRSTDLPKKTYSSVDSLLFALVEVFPLWGLRHLN